MANNYRKERNKLVKEMQEAEAPRIRHKKIEDTTQARKNALDLSSSINERLGKEQEELERAINRQQEEIKSTNVSRETSEEVTPTFVKPKKVKPKKGRQKKEKEKKFGEGIYGEKRKYTKEERSRLQSEVMKEYWRKRRQREAEAEAFKQARNIEQDIKDIESKGGQLTPEEEALFGSFDDLSEDDKNDIAPSFEVINFIEEHLQRLSDVHDFGFQGHVMKKDGLFYADRYHLLEQFKQHISLVKSSDSFEEYIHYLEENEGNISDNVSIVLYYGNFGTDGEKGLQDLIEIILQHPLSVAEAKSFADTEGESAEWEMYYSKTPFEE